MWQRRPAPDGKTGQSLMDDITFLSKYGQVQEYVAFVDSFKRDKKAHVSPSEFSITWNTPFTMVVGLDVLDVSLPQSGYVINTTYNQVRFRFHVAGYADDPNYRPPDWTVVAVRPGNHTPSSLMQELNDKLVAPASGTQPAKRIEVRAASEPFELLGKVVFVSEHPFELDVDKSSLAPILGFSQLMDVTVSDQIAAFTQREPLLVQTSEVTMLAGATSTAQGYGLTRGRFLKQSFRASTSSDISAFEVMVVPFGDTAGLDGVVNLRVRNARTNAAVVSGRIPVLYPKASRVDMGSIVVHNPRGDMFFATEKYWVEVFDDNNTDPNNCYRVCYGPGDLEATLHTVENGVEDSFVDHKVMMTATLRSVPFNFVLVPPGILNLASPVGYVTLRCSEIEKHMYANRAFEVWNMGLAVVNLAKGYQEKYSLVAPKRSFHPIARLSRLTFRWEAPDGSLFDFLGVDNHITFVLRYYALPQHTSAIHSALNPHYRPDLLDWVNDNELRDGDSSEDDSDGGSPATARQQQGGTMMAPAYQVALHHTV